MAENVSVLCWWENQTTALAQTCQWQQQAKSSWSQADHPQLLSVALHLSRALTALHLPGYTWFLLGQVLCIKVSGIYSSLTAGRSRHRKRLKFVCLPLQKLTQTLVLWTEMCLSCVCVDVCPMVLLLQHGDPPGASQHGASSWGWDILVSVRVRRGVLFCVKEGWVLRSSAMAEWVENETLLYRSELGKCCQFCRRICQDAETALPLLLFPLLQALMCYPLWYCSAWSNWPGTDSHCSDILPKEEKPPNAILASDSGTNRKPKWIPR